MCNKNKIKSKNTRQAFHSLIYNLLYPAMLGSMIYDIFDVKWDYFRLNNLGDYISLFFVTPEYLIKASIVLFYLVDYYHLYNYMQKEYPKKLRTKLYYMIPDFLVSIFLLIAFQCYDICSPFLSVILICLVPLLFLWYSWKLEKEKSSNSIKFYRYYAAFSANTTPFGNIFKNMEQKNKKATDVAPIENRRERENNINIATAQDLVIYKTPDGDISINVIVENDTVWLSQNQMGMLFDKDRRTISWHINNVFREGELQEEVVCQDYWHTTQHGSIKGKTQENSVKIYNLDVIISVGYRVIKRLGQKTFCFFQNDIKSQ
jgi:hypothetical protein